MRDNLESGDWWIVVDAVNPDSREAWNLVGFLCVYRELKIQVHEEPLIDCSLLEPGDRWIHLSHGTHLSFHREATSANRELADDAEPEAP